jgi:hypothetical protein
VTTRLSAAIFGRITHLVFANKNSAHAFAQIEAFVRYVNKMAEHFVACFHTLEKLSFSWRPDKEWMHGN